MFGQTEEKIGADPVVATSLDGDGVAAIVALTLADTVLLAAGWLADMHVFVLLPLHLVLVGLLSRRLAPLDARTRFAWPFGVMLLLVVGPPGGLGVLVLAMLTRFAHVDRSALDSWYATLTGDQRPDPSRTMHEALLAGREMKPMAIAPRRFAEVLAHGAVSEKQALLGHIGLNYHADYFPLLGQALRSPEAGVRAQAAAVFVKLKEGTRNRLHETRAAAKQAQCSGDGAAMLVAAARMLACAKSGFLDLLDAREAKSQAELVCKAAVELGAPESAADLILCRIVASTGDGQALIDRMVQKLPGLTATLRDELARCMVAAGRHADLNMLLTAFPPVFQSKPAFQSKPVLQSIPVLAGTTSRPLPKQEAPR